MQCESITLPKKQWAETNELSIKNLKSSELGLISAMNMIKKKTLIKRSE